MDEKIKDQEALLMKDSKDENLKALSGTDEKGGLKTVSPTAEHEQSFLKFDKHSNALENFLSNFIRQFKPPHTIPLLQSPLRGCCCQCTSAHRDAQSTGCSLQYNWNYSKQTLISNWRKYEGKQLIPATKELHILITSVFTYEIIDVVSVKK